MKKSRKIEMYHDIEKISSVSVDLVVKINYFKVYCALLKKASQEINTLLLYFDTQYSICELFYLHNVSMALPSAKKNL